MRFLLLVLVCGLASIVPVLAQSPMRGESPQMGSPPTMDINPSPPDGIAPDSHIKHELEKRLADEREASLKTDTDRLLKLSEELKTYVDKSDQNILSLDVIRKAAEIEKLAKSVKDKMKGPN